MMFSMEAFSPLTEQQQSAEAAAATYAHTKSLQRARWFWACLCISDLLLACLLACCCYNNNNNCCCF
jgi:hypothetical protein